MAVLCVAGGHAAQVRYVLVHGLAGNAVAYQESTHVPWIVRWILNHWTTREAPAGRFFTILATQARQPSSVTSF